MSPHSWGCCLSQQASPLSPGPLPLFSLIVEAGRGEEHACQWELGSPPAFRAAPRVWWASPGTAATRRRLQIFSFDSSVWTLQVAALEDLRDGSSSASRAQDFPQRTGQAQSCQGQKGLTEGCEATFLFLAAGGIANTRQAGMAWARSGPWSLLSSLRRPFFGDGAEGQCAPEAVAEECLSPGDSLLLRLT